MSATTLVKVWPWLVLVGLVARASLVLANDPPEITLRPRNQQVKAGGITSFYCIARGDPIPVIQWRKNGKRVSGTQSRYLVQEFPPGGSLLRIEPVRVARDDATYECVAENGVGDAVSAEASLTVYEGKTYYDIVYSDCGNLVFGALSSNTRIEVRAGITSVRKI
uniref:Tyrosine-protein phosphatase Lar n=1 Tax=Cacopsylla melanoneura TaxID=428564 RepID=A0A8D8WHP4_9HEMI